jgi:hypothetical protein
MATPPPPPPENLWGPSSRDFEYLYSIMGLGLEKNPSAYASKTFLSNEEVKQAYQQLNPHVIVVFVSYLGTVSPLVQ